VTRLLFQAFLHFILLTAAPFSTILTGTPVRLVWPTPNTAFREGLGIEHYLQPTETGDPKSGGFGCVRNNGARFHEGVDLKAMRRDSRGEAVDPIVAIMDGQVAHVNRNPGKSSYGRYLVLVHSGQKPTLYSLYAHLRNIEPQIEKSFFVKAGETLGIMGRSATYAIPKARAHLHFEIGLQLSESFQKWYELKKFDDPNEHGNFNGMNLIGLDPLAFFSHYEEKGGMQADDYIKNLPTAFTLRVNTKKTPDFIVRYASLLNGVLTQKSLAGWDIDFTGFGLPIRWKPLAKDDLVEHWRENRVILLDSRSEKNDRFSCRSTISANGSMGANLKQILELLFDFRPQ